MGIEATNRALTGKVAVVTGASKGIGVTIARRLAAEGASVALLARTVEALQTLATELGDNALAVACDVGDPSSVNAAFATVADRFGRVDLLVNNAGIIAMSLLEDADDHHIASQIAANLTGPIVCCRAAIPLLKAAGGGHIVNISSRSVELARPYLSVYSATKGGLETFSRTLAAELRPHKIKVSAIRVGPVASEPTVEAGDRGSGAVTDEWVKRGGPAPEPPSPPEAVADAVVFIATSRPQSRYPVVILEPE